MRMMWPEPEVDALVGMFLFGLITGCLVGAGTVALVALRTGELK